MVLRIFKNNKGFTLIETLVYVAILVIISVVIINIVLQMLSVNETTRQTREALDNARRGIETISQEIHHATSVYTPTSVFGSANGQLSLETTRDLPSDETHTFVDFYVDNGTLYLKRENQTAKNITSEKVKVTNLTFTSLNSTSYYPAVQISITAAYNTPLSGQKNKVTLTTTASLRDNQ